MKTSFFWALLFVSNSFGQAIVSSPASIFQSFASNATTATATLSLSGSGTADISTQTQSGGNWLLVTPASGNLPLTAQLSIDPRGLPDGTYNGSVYVGGVRLVPVIIAVGDPGPILPANGLVNAASFKGNVISPGEIVTLFGKNLGPKIAYGAQLRDGVFTAKIAGTRVWFDDTPAPLVYALPDQVSAVVPYNVAGKASVQVQVENMVARTVPITVAVQGSTPALFTANASGAGALAALNQDGTVNSVDNPAGRGSIVVLFATGAGTMNPGIGDGTIVSVTPPPLPVLPVALTIGGQDSSIVYAGAAPQLVVGVLQVNAKVPTTITAGQVPVVLTIGSVASPPSCTIFVR